MFKSKKKEKENLETVQYFYRLLSSRIANKDILEYIMEQLKYGADNNTIAMHTENEIIIREKNFNESFHLIVKDASIETEEVKWQGRSTVTKKIEFDNDIITVTSTEHNRIVTGDVYSTFERVTTIETYKDNELCHKRVVESSTSANGTANYATDTETYIKADKSAVQRHISVCEDEDDVHSTHIVYRKTNSYDAPPFDTSKQTHTVYMYGMSNTTKEEYDAFIAEYDKSYTYKKAQ